MESQRYIHKNKCRSQLPLNYGGDGRYFYVLCAGTSPAKVSVIDSTLITAANYLGAGLWTTNPEVALITLSAGTCYGILFVPTTKEVWVFGTTNTKIIDANPNSPAFNTEIANLTGAFASPVFAVAWDSWNESIIANGGQTLNQIFPNRSTGYASANAGIESNRMGKFFNRLGLTMFCNEGLGLSLIDSSEIINNYGVQKRNFITILSSGSAAWSSEKYIYYAISGNVYVYDAQFTLVTTIAITAARCARPGFSEKNFRLIFGNLFGNTISFIEESTLTGGGNLTKTYIAGSEDGTREFVCSDDVAIAIPSAFGSPSTTFTHIHGINMAAKTYIGYIPITGTLASFTYNNSYNVNNACKNRIEV